MLSISVMSGVEPEARLLAPPEASYEPAGRGLALALDGPTILASASQLFFGFC